MTEAGDMGKLARLCEENGWLPPTYTVFSDRRGGRTAWTAAVFVFDQYYAALFWWDGKFIPSAKEGAAWVALKKLHQRGFSLQVSEVQASYSGVEDSLIMVLTFFQVTAQTVVSTL
jgi:hypothetical protein